VRVGVGAAARGTAIAVALAGALGACAVGGRTTAGAAAAPAGSATDRSFDFSRRVGMVEGERSDSLWLMIADSTLAPGDSLTLISDEPEPDPDSPPEILTAAVAERLHRNPHDKMHAEPGDAFYRLVAPPGALTCCIFGYAVRAPRGDVTVVAGRAEVDLDRDGVLERFQSCASTEGLHLALWSGEPFRGVEQWTRYYYLEYDLEPNCPEDSLQTDR
jgi:hypothetical protein